MAQIGSRMPAMAGRRVCITTTSQSDTSLHVRNACQEESGLLAILPHHNGLLRILGSQ